MSTIHIPQEIEIPLAEAARRHGTTPELLALECLRRIYAPTTDAQTAANGGTLADFLDGYVGTIDGSTEAFSTDTGRRFADSLFEKRRGEQP